MKPKELLSWISRVDSLLSEFSFEELPSTEASILKDSFDSFKQQLEDTIAGNGISEGKLLPKPDSSESLGDVNREAALIANVSHELRTPLNGIIGFADLLKENSLNETQLMHVNAIQSASSSMMDIVSELLEYSKLSAGQEVFEAVHFNFYRLLRDVIFLGKTLIVQKNVLLEMAIDPAIPEILIGDPTKLSQILLNLMGNAIKFVDEGQIDLKIILQKKKGTTLFIEFEISDNGIGIDAEQLPHIFDSYRQADKETSKNYGGTGLGLSIVKQIVTQLGGAISVASNLDKGTTFKFFVPFTEGDRSKLRKNNSNKAYLKNGAKHIKGTRILVFEDNSLNQRLITQRLTQWGCAVFVTDNAEYGINILKEQSIDLVLMDLRMPRMSGFEVSELIRKHKTDSISQVPIIALTADFTIRDKKKSELHGINDYLLKPYSPDELLLKLLVNKKLKNTHLSLEEPTLKKDLKPNLETPDFDLSFIVDDCMGKLELVAELIHLFKQNVLEFIGEIKSHLVKKDFNGMEFSLHKVKSGLAMMQTNSLHDIVLQMETCLKTNGDLNHLNFLFECFIAEYPSTEEGIQKEFQKLKNKL